MDRTNEQNPSTAPLRCNTKENDAPTQQAMLAASNKQADTTKDSMNVDYQLSILKELSISNSEQHLDDESQSNDETVRNPKDDSRPSHREGSEDLFHREHATVYSYFFENCPVAGELQELRLKASHLVCFKNLHWISFVQSVSDY